MKQRSSIQLANPDLRIGLSFLREIGIECNIHPGARGFIDLLLIQDGALLVDPRCPVSNLLHDAGHLAIFPAQYRALTQSNVDVVVQLLLSDAVNEGEPDSPFYRAAIQSSDPEATAWAWAAGLAAGLPPRRIILNSEYGGDGASIRSCLQLGRYMGIHGLMHSGMCLNPRAPGGFPQMLRWTQPEIRPQASVTPVTRCPWQVPSEMLNQ